MAVAAFPSPAPHHVAAIDLERLVTWAIRNQKADRANIALFEAEVVAHYGLLYDLPIGGGTAAGGFSADGVVAIQRKGALGVEIDGGGAMRGIAPTLHPDAEAVATIIEDRLSPGERRVVLDHARHGDRPEWLASVQALVAAKRPSDAPGRYRAVVDGAWEPTPTQAQIAQRYVAAGVSLIRPDGARRIVEEERGYRFRRLNDGTRQVLARWTRVEPKRSAAEVEESQTEYRLWHWAMRRLLYELQGVSLRDHVITGFAAPAAPWEQKP